MAGIESNEKSEEMMDGCECPSPEHGGSCIGAPSVTIKGICWYCIAFCEKWWFK